MERLIARRYSKALFDLAIEQNMASEYNAAARTLADIIEKDDGFMQILKNPSISRSQKSTIVNAALKDRVPTDFVGMIELILKRGREQSLVDIFRDYESLYNDYRAVAIAKLTTPTQLDAEIVNQISQIVSKKINKTVEIQMEIDPGLVAGFCIEVDGFIFDATTKTKLAGLKKHLLKSAVKIGDQQ